MGATRDLKTTRDTIRCDVCGRSLLRGEESTTYVGGGARRQVCELCAPRARHEGWRREDSMAQDGLGLSDNAERRSFMARLRRREREAEQQPRLQKRRPEPAPGEPPAPEHVHAIPAAPEHKLAHAVVAFNSSVHTRTIASVARSLGTPIVCVYDTPGERAIVHVIVAWELCWYRFEVDLDSDDGVHQIGQGYELSELAEHEQRENAFADERGQISLAS